MVTYEYYCEECKIIWERFYKSSPENPSDPIICDECGGEARRAWITPPAAKTSMPWEGTGRSVDDYLNSYRREITDLRVEHSKKQADLDTVTGPSPYSNVSLNYEVLKQKGVVKESADAGAKREKNLKMAQDYVDSKGVRRVYSEEKRRKL